MNLPNRLTLLRILLIPVFVVLVSINAIPGNYLLAALVFIGASITDYLDGSIARKRDMVTDFGKFADPLADKILTTVAFIYMLVDGVCHPLVLVIIIVREFAVSGVRMVAAGAPDGKVIAANRMGKAKTVLQMVTIITYYVLAGVQRLLPVYIDTGTIPQIIAWVLCWAVAAITAISGVQYIWQNRAYINTKK
ncbi:MAG: CDP-diacylglycerol--glycerol-3-phosphate 3-phosphatidyltransferase [Ruminococcaceae bacterium]|nr:CDP-diacylglycerol--glycerol-3-phosphate 3-phosphatidyltransferase [Oscillospiraceae bacterium]